MKVGVYETFKRWYRLTIFQRTRHVRRVIMPTIVLALINPRC